MSAVEFEVSEITETGFIWGRNGRVDIPQGFTFTSIQKVRVEGQRESMHSVRLGEVSSIKLHLEEIQWYRRAIAVVPGGHTAGLRLRGEGINELREALSQCAKDEYLYLTGIASGA